MSNETVTKSSRFYCVSLTPDICKTPMGASKPPVPYAIVGEFSAAAGASPNVKSHSEAVILHQRSTIPTVKGDEAGSAGGVKSGTTGSKVETKTASSAHRANGASKVQVGREVWMNARNTIGKIYERGGMAARPLLTSLRAPLSNAAQRYKDDYSVPAHNLASGLIDAGERATGAGAVISAFGVVAAATVVGAPVGVVAEAVAAPVAATGGAAVASGAALETSAGVLDKTADFILTGQLPNIAEAALDVAGNLVSTLAQSFVLRRLGSLGKVVGEKLAKWLTKAQSAKPGKKATSLATKPKPPKKKGDDGKERGKPGPKSDAPSDCCPKDQGPAKKPVKGKKPIHFGTGQEILEQTDFVLHGAMQLAWTRTYRSGAETEDWGLLGARWNTEYTTGLSLADKGIIYHDDTGRALRLPALSRGESYDSRKEGFTLTRTDTDEFTLTWRNGITDTFHRGDEGWLPHGYDGVNAMLTPAPAARAARFDLVRSAGRDGRGITIEHLRDAKPGAVLLRIQGDDGSLLEAMQVEDIAGHSPGPFHAPRIGRVEQVLADGTRLCHVRYTYGADPAPAPTDERPRPPVLPQRHNLTGQTNLLGHTRHYEYRWHLLTSCSTYGGFTQQLEWISLAALRSRWRGSQLDNAQLASLYPITAATSYQARAISSQARDGSGRLTIDYLDENTSRITENGSVLDYTFDRNWLATDVRRVRDGIAQSLGKRAWDNDGMLLAESGVTSPAIHYRYDAAGNVISSTDAAGHTSHIEYDSNNQPVRVTDAAGNIFTQTYDQFGRVTSSTDALGRTTAYRYDSDGRLAAIIDAKGGSKTLEYGQAGQLIAYTDCSGYTTLYRYDAQGRLTATIDALRNQTTYAYDELGQLLRVTQPDATYETYQYDADGNLLTHTDAAGHQTHYRYNGLGMPLLRTDALGQTLEYRYDNALQLIELINAAGQSYRFTYNDEGWLTAEIGFNGKPTHYTYDGDGQLTSSDCLGQRIDLIHDSRGLLRVKTTRDETVQFVYDILGRMTSAWSKHAELHFAYDAAGQLTEERTAYFLNPTPEEAYGPATARKPDAAFVMSHSYDELGNRIQTVLPDGHRIDTLRYGSGHWHGTLWDGVTVVDIERDRLHRETKRYFGSGKARVTATRSYDKLSRITAMTLEHDPSKASRYKIRDRKFDYDTVGNLTAIKHGWHSRDETLGTFTYSYDPLGQLLRAEQPGLIETFSYDQVGNMFDSSLNEGNPIPENLVELTSLDVPLEKDIEKHTITSCGQFSYGYDLIGNLSIKQVKKNSEFAEETLKLNYNTENRTIQAVRITKSTITVSKYLYDPFGRRIAKIIFSYDKDYYYFKDEKENILNSKTVIFLWDDQFIAQEISQRKNITYLYEPENGMPLGKFESQNMANDADLQLHANEIATVAQLGHSHDFKYYGCDQVGNPREIFNAAGIIFWKNNSSAWGRNQHNEKNEFQPIRFLGQYEDKETGLHYNRYRYYDPVSASFTTPDPIGLNGGLNHYAYAPNPTGWTDAALCRFVWNLTSVSIAA